MTQGDLKAILEAGDVEACVAYFELATEDERKAVAGLALESHAEQAATPMIAESPTRWRTNPLLGAAAAAVRASCSLSQLKKRGLNLTLEDADFRVLEARKPDWITDYAGWSLERNPAVWPSVRRLERAGLCRRPDTDHYVLGLIQGAIWRHGKADVRAALLSDPELLEREVWHLFEVEGSGEFSLAAHDKYCNAPATWESGLVALAADGTLPRDRLLDESLDALERDFAQFRAGWFSRFHEALTPTLEERAERVERYLNLLGSKIPPTVSFALSALSKVDRAKRLAAGALIDRISPALTARSKGAVSSALKLLADAANRDPALKRRAAMIAAQALTHESPDAQSEAFDLVVYCGDRGDLALVDSIRAQVDQLATSVQARVREWLGCAKAGTQPGSSSTAPMEAELERLIARASTIAPRLRELAGIDAVVAAMRAGSFDVAALGFDGTEFPRLDPAAEIQPIVDLDELIDVFSAVLENPDATDDVERVLDGVSRLCGHRPGDFNAHTSPLRKRATALLERGSSGDHYGPFMGWQPALDLCGLALSWTSGEAIDPDLGPRFEKRSGRLPIPMCDYQKKVGKWSGTAHVIEHSAEMLFLSRRALAVARRAATGQAELLLSAPTHQGGWIDPIVLVDRIEQRTRAATTPDVYDQVQAILRLAPDRREEARRRLENVDGEFTQALRYALGGDNDAIGPTPALWISAARARAPFDNDPRVLARHPNLGPDAGTTAKFAYRVKLKPAGEGKTWADFRLDCEPPVLPDVPAEFATVRLHTHRHKRDPATIRWGATVWPIAREAWLAQGVATIGINLDWWEARWSDRTYLQPLTDPDLPLKPMALLLLTLGLAAKQADEHGLATDGLIAAIDDGRIDGALFGGAMRSLLPTGLIKPSRWAKTLRDAARVSPLHALIVAHAVQHALGDELVEPLQDMLALLELLKELLIEVGEPVSLTHMRVWLAGWKASGKTAKVVKDLLALTDSGDPSGRRGAALRALAQRIERAERWSRNVR
jgi:hypothetical protein